MFICSLPCSSCLHKFMWLIMKKKKLSKFRPPQKNLCDQVEAGEKLDIKSQMWVCQVQAEILTLYFLQIEAKEKHTYMTHNIQWEQNNSLFWRTKVIVLFFFFFHVSNFPHALPWWLRWQRICLQCGRPGINPWVRNIPWRREW